MTEPQPRLLPDHRTDVETVVAPQQSEWSSNDSTPEGPGRSGSDYVGRYRIERILGQGGFGLVYLARDEQLDRLVAVKVPHPRLVTREEDVAAYLAEARAAASLDHPRIVPVFDVGSGGEHPCFIVSKYIDGTDLSSRIRQQRLPLVPALELVATVAEALQHAHRQGLVHRDIKPGNILLDQAGQPYLTDFGLALRERDPERGPQYAGTPAYMSPEQARGEGHRVDGRSDLFSLGVVLYELLVGKRPFQGATAEELREQVIGFEPRPPRQCDAGIPREVDRICLRALAKRASERYSTAQDLADDLWQFLAGSAGTALPGERPESGAADSRRSERTSREDRIETGRGSTGAQGSVPGASGPQPVRIVPRGLRSFEALDADFFLELLPGPRDRDGLPDSLRFWKTRIEEMDADSTFPVGLIYGPSGCGKSSLVKAGLLPRLAATVHPVYVEATAEETQSRLLRGLRKLCPGLEENLSLRELLAAVRRGREIPAGHKVLIVLDQFEQWLHARPEIHHSELVQALRQCDGSRVQCLVLVRDDFWLAATRFLKELEINLLQGNNTAAVDLFDREHARKALALYGVAFGRLPERAADRSREQQEFLEQVVSGVAQDGQVACVRLALFAEMMKSRVWTPGSLREVGGTAGVGERFLEEVFSSAGANPQHRLHQKAARLVLQALLPGTGTDLKGHMRSSAELREASGYGSRPREFTELIRILDRELRLITPTDPEGLEDAGRGETGESSRELIGRYYQLTHDYLVPSLRAWLTRKQRETRRGRAELRLIERAGLWQVRPENRHLPSWWEYLTAVWLVPVRNRTAAQRQMLRKAGQVHAVRWGIGLAVLLGLALGIWLVVQRDRRHSVHQQVVTAVDAVQNNRGLAVPFTLRDLQRLPRDLVLAELRTRYAPAGSQQKLGLAYAFAEYDEVDVEYLCSQIERAAPEEVENLVTALSRVPAASLAELETQARRAEANQNWRLKSRLAILGRHLADDRMAQDMCQIAGRADPVQRTTFINELPAWHGDLVRLARRGAEQGNPDLRSALCLAVGSLPADRLTPAEIAAWQPLLTVWWETQPDPVTHSAAGWALHAWGLEPSPLPATSPPRDDRQWFVNSLGLTLLRLEPGEFVRRDERDPAAFDQTVRLTTAFYLSDREISVGQFLMFLNDPDCPPADKPARWPGQDPLISPAPDHPVQMVSWYDAVLFCNWLSRREGLTPCYERTGDTQRVDNTDQDVWSLVPHPSGYRLPTEAEWEYACRAGTSTDFSCGSQGEILHKYAKISDGHRQGAVRCGSRLPNGWGLFDLHGNVREWCQDWDLTLTELIAIDPAGPPTGSLRESRGGTWLRGAKACRSGERRGDPPASRFNNLGFRTAISAPLSVPRDIRTTRQQQPETSSQRLDRDRRDLARSQPD